MMFLLTYNLIILKVTCSGSDNPLNSILKTNIDGYKYIVVMRYGEWGEIILRPKNKEGYCLNFFIFISNDNISRHYSDVILMLDNDLLKKLRKKLQKKSRKAILYS